MSLHRPPHTTTFAAPSGRQRASDRPHQENRMTTGGLILFYDTETTGLPDFKAPSEADHQPHIVQIAAAVVDASTRKVLSSLDLMVRPNGWVIPAEVSAIHGITTEKAGDIGVSEDVALSAFLELWRGKVRVGHNESFDARIIRIAMMRYAAIGADEWKDGRAECTAKLATPICKLPPTDRMLAAGRRHYKTANLTEAYRHLVGLELENAHSATADVAACMAVYFAIKDQA